MFSIDENKWAQQASEQGVQTHSVVLASEKNNLNACLSHFGTRQCLAELCQCTIISDFNQSKTNE